jgi:hypothetical protein
LLALVIALLVIVLLLAVVVAGLLRSHADILRSLHSLGVGVGDPGAPATGLDAGHPVSLLTSSPQPHLPAERSSAVHDLEGVTPSGEAVVVAVEAAPLTLLAFLTSGCESCARLWGSLGDPAQRRLLPPQVRVVAVTKGPEWESQALVESRAPAGIQVVMSTAAWADYEIPGSPYFVLLNGSGRRRAGEGVGHDLAQIAGLVGRSFADDAAQATGAFASRSAPFAVGLNGAQRESHNDAVLRAAGIGPGHPSLYPRTAEDVFPRPRNAGEPSSGGQ